VATTGHFIRGADVLASARKRRQVTLCGRTLPVATNDSCPGFCRCMWAGDCCRIGCFALHQSSSERTTLPSPTRASGGIVPLTLQATVLRTRWRATAAAHAANRRAGLFWVGSTLETVRAYVTAQGTEEHAPASRPQRQKTNLPARPLPDRSASPGGSQANRPAEEGECAVNSSGEAGDEQ